VPVEEVGTDRGRLETWSKQAAIQANKVVREMGIERRGLVEDNPSGYIAAFLDGIWLRAPYLHNGSVPTLRDLLEPVERRPKRFYRGYDVYNQVKVGFVTSPAEADVVGMRCEMVQEKKLCEVERIGTPYDVSQRGSGNQGHLYGTDLPSKDKEALVEYMKTL
jgi:hypothetical protein